MRRARVVLAVIALVVLGLAAFYLTRNVSATAVAGGPTWPCGSVARPELPAAYGLAAATPNEGRQTFALDQVACSAARDRQLANAVPFLLLALGLVVLSVLLAGKSRVYEPALAVPA